MSFKIKVLHIYKESFPSAIGGVAVFMDTLCKSSSDLGVDNTIFALSKTPSLTPIELKTHRIIEAKQNFFVASTGFSLSAFSQFRLLAPEADIIHYHFPNPFSDILHLLNHLKKPTLVTYHSDIVKQKQLMKLYQKIMHKFLISVDHIVATSPNYVKTSDILREYKDKTSIIPIGITQKHLAVTNQDRVGYWGKRFPQRFFLFVGALRYYKGLSFALDAVKGSDIQLVLAGKGGDEQLLKKQAKQNNLKNVHFLGMVSEADKMALMKLCYGFIFPSHLRSEAFGISLLEASACSKPLISCEIGTGTSFVNINEETGLVVQPASQHSLRKAMQYLLDNPFKVKEFGENAFSRYKAYFTAEHQARSYYKIYKKLLTA